MADVKWVTAPPCYVFHPMNHYDLPDGRIVIDVVKYDVAPLFPLPDGSLTRNRRHRVCSAGRSISAAKANPSTRRSSTIA